MPYKLMFTFIIILGSVVSSYFLYKNGLFTRHMTVSFMQRSFFWKNKGWAKFGFCHGYIKKFLSIKESRDYKFTFNAGITKGYVCAEIQDKYKNVLLCLDILNPENTVYLDSGTKYYLILKFNRAAGELEIEWN